MEKIMVYAFYLFGDKMQESWDASSSGETPGEFSHEIPHSTEILEAIQAKYMQEIETNLTEYFYKFDKHFSKYVYIIYGIGSIPIIYHTNITLLLIYGFPLPFIPILSDTLIKPLCWYPKKFAYLVIHYRQKALSLFKTIPDPMEHDNRP